MTKHFRFTTYYRTTQTNSFKHSSNKACTMQSTKRVERIINPIQRMTGREDSASHLMKGRTNKRNKPQRGRPDAKYFDSMKTNEEGATV